MEPIFTVNHDYSKEDLIQLREIGVKCFRVNPARIGIDRGIKLCNNIKEIIPDSVLYVDTAGSKMRVILKEKSVLLHGQVKISFDENADLQISHNLFKAIKIGDVLVIRASEKNKEIIITKVEENTIYGQTKNIRVRNNAHIYIKNKYFPNTKLYEVDVQILKTFTMADRIGVSFLDYLDLAEKAKAYTDIDLYAKIESPVGVSEAEKIIDGVSGIIIARDDLSRFYNTDQLDIITDYLIDVCCKKRKAFIPASNLFEDLLHKPDMDEENKLRLQHLRKRGTQFVYCNETAICKEIKMIEKIWDLCK